MLCGHWLHATGEPPQLRYSCLYHNSCDRHAQISARKIAAIQRLWRARSTSSRRPFHSAPLRSAMACAHRSIPIRMPHYSHTSNTNSKDIPQTDGFPMSQLASLDSQKQQEGPLTPTLSIDTHIAVQCAGLATHNHGRQNKASIGVTKENI